MKGLPRTIALAMLAALIPACGEPPRIVVFVPPPVNGIPSAALLAFVGTQTGTISVAYTLTDAESNPVAVLVEFSTNGGTSYSPATRAPGGEGITGLLSSPGGSPHTFLWDTVIDNVGQAAVATVRLRITPSDADPGTPGTTDLTVDNPITVFRVNSMSLRDPHISVPVPPLLPCADVTDSFLGGAVTIAPYGPVTGGVNGLINVMLTTDKVPAGAPDGFLDASPLMIFRRFNPAATSGTVEFAPGQCDVAGSSCDLAPMAVPVPTTFTAAPSGTLLSPIALTTSGYSPAVASASGPGFASDPVLYTLNLGGLILPLEGFRLAATYPVAGSKNMTNGLAMGFLPAAVADLVPVNLGGTLGTVMLSSLLPGGTGACSATDDRDTGPDLVPVGGWWFYLNFTAVQTPYTGP
jgi:hypothetical protein